MSTQLSNITAYGAYEIIMMLHHLHTLGYQQLRLLPGLSPNGCNWRWMIYPKALMGTRAELERHNDSLPFQCPCGTTGEMRTDADYAQLARTFLSLYEPYATLGLAPDEEYTQWYASHIVRNANHSHPPIAFADGPIGPTWQCGPHPIPFPPFSPVAPHSLSESQARAYTLLSRSTEV